MERKEQEPSGKPPQAAEGGDNQLSEKKRAIVALTRILGSGPLDEESLRLLEQLADCVRRPQAEVLQEAEPTKQVAAQQITAWKKSRPRPNLRRCRRGSQATVVTPNTSQKKE